jgi:hypothetical protein
MRVLSITRDLLLNTYFMYMGALPADLSVHRVHAVLEEPRMYHRPQNWSDSLLPTTKPVLENEPGSSGRALSAPKP